MEFKKSVLKLNVYGTEVELNFPTMKSLKEFNTVATADGADELEETINFLDGLGLPRHISEELEPEHFQAVVEALSAKKN